MTTAETERRGLGAFGLVVGVLAGLLIASVAVPRRQPEQVAVGHDGVESSTADGAGFDPNDPEALAEGAAGLGGSGSGGPGGSAGASASDLRAAIDAAGSSSAGGTAGATRGLTDDSITIGIAYPNLGALKALGPAFDNGDVPKQWNALIDGYRKSGLVPVNGRNIRLVFRDYNVLAPEEQRAACTGLINDDKSLLVIAQTYFLAGAECVARENKTLLITSDGPDDPIFDRSAPLLFSLGMSEDRVLRNLAAWADERGLLAGKKVGIYYENTALYRDQMNRTVKAELSRRGYKIAAEVTTDQRLGGPQDAVAVQRFSTAGVDIALLFTSKAGFMQQADAQAYHPAYLDSDFGFGTSDSATSTYPKTQYDGTVAFTGRRVGETPAGIALGAEGEACLANYERFAGGRPPVESAEWAYILTGCDLGKTLLVALTSAGRDLTPGGMVAGLETMRTVPMTRYAPVTFTRDKHHGVDSYRELKWYASCSCWKATGPFQPLPSR